MTTTIDDEADGYVRALAARLTDPSPGECLACYLNRMLNQFGCDGSLRFALAYRDAVAPRATALARTLGNSGGYCDDEVLMNVYEPAARLWVPPRRAPLEPRWDDDDDDDPWGDLYDEPDNEPPEVMPACATVRKGSTRPCLHWQCVRRGAW